MTIELRLPEESDQQFQRRVERTARIARLLVDACLSNECVQQLIADPSLPWFTERGCRVNPTVRIEYEQAIAIGGIGECLRATRSKHWGEGPQIVPLEPDDPVNPGFVLYLYRENSVYNRRFEQRRRMKQLLGRSFRGLVGRAMQRRQTKEMFLAELTTADRQAIEAALHVTPAEFWQLARGKRLAATLPRERQRVLPLDVTEESRDSRPLGVAATIDDFATAVRDRSGKPAASRQMMIQFGDDIARTT